jgi:hypothetical protein
MAVVIRRLAIALPLSALVALSTPSTLSAEPLALHASFLNSNLTFGGSDFVHYGYDVDSLSFFGVDHADDFPDTEFEATGGSLVSTTLVLDGSGRFSWPHTVYRYAGGTLTVDVRKPGFHPAGLFTAPILSLEIYASEPPDPYGSGGGGGSVMAFYTLDAGVFDDALASLLGIPKHTGGTTFANADMRLLFGDHSSPEFVADDGAFELDVPPAAVPEPALSLLLGTAAIALMRVRRGRRRT